MQLVRSRPDINDSQYMFVRESVKGEVEQG